MQAVSVLDPIDQQVRKLNEFKPLALAGYPSAWCYSPKEKALGAP